MAGKMSLEEASTIIAQITALDAKLASLIQNVESSHGQLELNKQEIKKRINLENANIELEDKIKKLKVETDSIKSEIDIKANALSGSGWVVPIPKRDINVKAFVSM